MLKPSTYVRQWISNQSRSMNFILTHLWKIMYDNGLKEPRLSVLSYTVLHQVADSLSDHNRTTLGALGAASCPGSRPKGTSERSLHPLTGGRLRRLSATETGNVPDSRIWAESRVEHR